MEDATLLSVEQGVATLTLNQPKSKNSLGPALMNSLVDNMKKCMEDDAVRVVVLTNVGNTFCAGANLKSSDKTKPKYTLVDLFALMHAASKPIVGRIAGHCTGGGCGLAAACDVSVMQDDCQLGFTEVRIGVSPAIISVVCLPKMRRADAAELFLSGEKISAARCKEVGLINHAVPAAELDSKVREITDKLVRGGPLALGVTKSLVYKVPGMTDIPAAFAWAAKLSAQCFASPEAAQGIAAFNKREDAPWVPKAKL
mmetsp:Transcript_106490/g.318258  ORF Transcript_106490/g.318258 Transcript_106490/m.318258 type:complete len:256 (+) Transcript_106490:86-853(+)